MAKKTYDIVLLERPLDTGLSKTEISAIFDLLPNDTAIPLEFQAEYSTAMGAIDTETAEALDYNYDALSEFIVTILNDMDNENSTNEYDFEGRSIYLTRDIF